MLLGKLGYKPWELHKITFREVHLSIEGLFEQNKYYHDLLRKATSLICSAGFNHNVAKKFKSLWPSEEKKSGKISQRALDQLFELRKVQAIKSAKEKIDARRPQIDS